MASIPDPFPFWIFRVKNSRIKPTYRAKEFENWKIVCTHAKNFDLQNDKNKMESSDATDQRPKFDNFVTFVIFIFLLDSSCQILNLIL